MDSAKRPLAAFSSLLCAALLCASGAAHATPASVGAFMSALRANNSQRALDAFPKKGSVKLFKEKCDYDKAMSRAKYDDLVFELIRWPKDGEKGVLPEVSETKQGRFILYAVRPAGQEGPVCFLRAPKPNVEPLLVECRDK